MLKVAYIFPGQGAQYVGMGADFYTASTCAKKTFEQANSVLGFDLAKLIFEGPSEQLTSTINCQVAVFTASVASLRSLQESKPAIAVSYTAGLSLGEYTALVAAGALDFTQALKLVQMRAQYMEEAAKANPGGMVSLIGLSLDKAKEICQQAEVEIANLNCPGQIVISGHLANLEQAKELAQGCGVKRIIPLKVSGAFHSSLMESAKQKLDLALEKQEIQTPEIPVISNVTAKEESSPQEIKHNLAEQVASGTYWEDSIRYISAQGIKHFLEIGPGKVLKGLLRRIDSELVVDNIETIGDLEKFGKEQAKCC
ncbi:MAG: ACP S-malonyltransferase [Candidatus Omnitrophica bacterium]|nr:ACP S-malonyltransferase [Candidatus Omnitrophota bacterium]